MRGRPSIGELVCTCRMTHARIIEISDDGDTIVTDDDWRCSYYHCCDSPDHTWKHEDVTTAADAQEAP